MTKLTHLYVITQETPKRSCVSIYDLIEETKKKQLDVLALTNTVLAGIPTFINLAKKEGIDPIVGVKVIIDYIDSKVEEEIITTIIPLVLLAENDEGYMNLLYKLTKDEGSYAGEPHYFDDEDFRMFNEGLIALLPSTCLKKMGTKFESILKKLKDAFNDNLYVLVNQQDITTEELVESWQEFVPKTGVKLAVGSEIRALHSFDKTIVQTLDAINNGKPISEQTTPAYLTNEDTLRETFQVLPEAILNTENIISRCREAFKDSVYMKSTQASTMASEFLPEIEKLAKEALLKIFPEPTAMQIERLNAELEKTKELGLAMELVTLYNMMVFLKDMGVYRGFGTGYINGSFLAYLLGIVVLDPMDYGLKYEMFFNSNVIRTPINFGREHYAKIMRIVTYYKYSGTFVRPICRFAKGEFQAKIEVDKVLAKQKEYDYKDEYTIKEGVANSTEYWGFDKSSVSLAYFDLSPATFTMNQATSIYSEEDLYTLGHGSYCFNSLEIIDSLNHILNPFSEFKNQEMHIEAIPLNDRMVFNYLQKSYTYDIFRLNSKHAQKAIRKIKPKNFEELIAVFYMFYPWWDKSENKHKIDTYVDYKDSLGKTAPYSKVLMDILGITNGLILYQEQIYEILTKYASYAPKDALRVRKEFRRRSKDILKNEQKIFLENTSKNGHDQTEAFKIWENMVKNGWQCHLKAEIITEALLTYVSAWLKYYYPSDYKHEMFKYSYEPT